MNNQADTSSTATLKLDPLRHVLSIFRLGSSRMKGYTTAEATDPSLATRKVEAIAHAELPKLELMASTVTANVTTNPSLEDRGVVVIRNFVADVACKSTGDVATSTVTGSWSATLNYWSDTNDNGTEDGRYLATPLTISGNVSQPDPVDPLAAIQAANPVVIDGLLPTDDVYLFEDPTSTPAKKGFLERWSSTRTMTSFKGAVTGGTGIETRVSMPFAINIVTARTDPANPETKLSINVGKLNCRAVDQR